MMTGRDTGSRHIEDGGQGGAHETLVRDLPVRVFHWSLVASVAVALFTGFLGEENMLTVHVWAGQAVAVLILFRIAWWFTGGRYSRLSVYPLWPGQVIAHLRGLLAGRSPLTAGHNPAGAWMIVTLIALLFALTLSGIFALGGEENLGPLCAFVSYRLGDAAEEVHEALAWLLLVAIAGHLTGVFMETRIFGHPLLRAMTRGRMPVPPEEAERGPLTLRGLVVFLLALGLFAAVWNGLSAMPDNRWRPITYPGVYLNNCGDCHHAHHPSLRTADMWERIVRGLEDHYGEDATVGGRTAEEILAFLKANSAERFDTEAAVRLGREETPDLRISSAPWWKKRHEEIPKAVFSSAAVGSSANCNACHRDAQTGRFDDARIRMPGEARAATGQS
ncbi:MAG TPA: hypothetical protein ENJ62_05645 [Bryobacterales bacterium]|nr:hypothetical protein [Bryobacterales bacterium]